MVVNTEETRAGTHPCGSPERARFFPSLARLGVPDLEAIARINRTDALAEGVSRQLSQKRNLRIALAQIKTFPTRLEENADKIKTTIEQAHAQGADLLVFPELALPGYGCLDQFQNPAFIAANLKALEEIVGFTRGKEINVIVGFADSGVDQKVYNSAALIKDGRLLDVVDKALLPDYDIFWESRYFAPARQIHPIEVEGIKVGVEICEDLWDRTYSVKVSGELLQAGAECLVNISASPFHPGKMESRIAQIRSALENRPIPFIYANLVGAQDGYEGEIVFDGRSMVFSSAGDLIGLGKGFKEDLLVVDIHAATPIALPDWSPVEEIWNALTLGIQDYFVRNGFKKAYIGLSGGIDSALTAALAVEALGAENVIGVTMPSHITSTETRRDALALAENLGIKCHLRPIEDQYRAWERDASAAHGGKLQDLTRQNAQARIRGQILMEYSNEDRSAIVLTTGNKTELAVGYSTLYGDMCGGLNVLGDVSKERVYELSRFANLFKKKDIIPQSTIDRPPSAELEAGQRDADDLPADYPILSPLADRIAAGRRSRQELEEDYPPEVVQRTMRLISRAEYKRRQAAPCIRVSEKSFGAGRRFPVDNRFYD